MRPGAGEELCPGSAHPLPVGMQTAAATRGDGWPYLAESRLWIFASRSGPQSIASGTLMCLRSPGKSCQEAGSASGGLGEPRSPWTSARTFLKVLSSPVGDRNG